MRGIIDVLVILAEAVIDQGVSSQQIEERLAEWEAALER